MKIIEKTVEQEFKLTPKREKELEKIAKDLPDSSFKSIYGEKWKSVKMAVAMNILKKRYGYKTEETKMKFKELREKMSGSKLTGQEISTWYRKNPDVKKAARDRKIKQAVEIALDHGGAMNFAIKKIEKIKRGLADHPAVAKALSYANFGEEKTLEEGTWAIPDSYQKMYDLQFNFLAKKVPATKSNAKKYAKGLYNLFGDDGFFDDLLRVELGKDDAPDTDDLRTILIKHLDDWNVRIIKSGSGYVITHAPKSWWEKEEEVDETAKKRKAGNIKPTGQGSRMKGKLMAEGVTKTDPLDRAERVLDYRLKELQYKAELRRFNEFEEDKAKQYRMEANNAPLAKRAQKRFKGIDKKLAQRIANVVKPGRVIQSKIYVELGDLWDSGDKKGFEKLLNKHEK